MKTIIEIQADLNTIVEQLTALSKDVGELSIQAGAAQASPVNEKMNELLKLLKDEHGKRRPLEGHPLAEKDHLIKNRYFSQLCAILLYQNTADEAQRIFMNRLMAGALAEHGVEDYMRMALGVTAESWAELMESLKNEPPIKYAFVLDMLLICHLQTCGEGQAAFIAEVLEALGVADEELNYLLSFAKAILALDRGALEETVKLRPAHIAKDAFIYYAQLMGDDAVAIITMSTTLEELIATAKGSDFDHIAANITLNNFNGGDFDNNFVRGRIITFRQCKFACEQPLRFGKFDKVAFEDCVFSDFKTKTVVLDDVTAATFLRCEFKNCVEHHESEEGHWNELGGVIKCKNGKKTAVTIDSCKFINCGGRNFYLISEPFSSIISDGNMTIRDSSFQNCWHYSKTEWMLEDHHLYEDPDDPQRVLFSHVTHEENNAVVDSANLCPK